MCINVSYWTGEATEMRSSLILNSQTTQWCFYCFSRSRELIMINHQIFVQQQCKAKFKLKHNGGPFQPGLNSLRILICSLKLLTSFSAEKMSHWIRVVWSQNGIWGRSVTSCDTWEDDTHFSAPDQFVSDRKRKCSFTNLSGMMWKHHLQLNLSEVETFQLMCNFTQTS